MEVRWTASYTKKVELKEDGVKAVFLFTPNKAKKIDSAVWKILKKKMADDIISGRLVVEDVPVVEDKPKRKRGKDKTVSFGVDGAIGKEEAYECE